MAQVSLQNLTKIYDRTVKAVDNINLDIEDREFVVLVGPSGCGKSTTLRMIAGLEEITEGTVTIDGKTVNEVPPKHRDIAMVFQNYALYPHMKVYDNMAFGLKLRKVDKAEIDRRVRDAARILGIEELLQRKPKALSGGQRQRVAVGRAIVRDPKAFLLDEPLSNLDAKMRVQMRTEISKLHHRLDATMIYVTHDQVEAMTMGDRICVMREGAIQQVDEPVRLYERPANIFVAGFIGTPPMNLFHGTLKASNGQLYFTGGDVEIALPPEWEKALADQQEKAVVFGARPEDIGSEQTKGREALPTIKAEVDVTEPMGSETYLYLKTERSRFIARVESHMQVSVGETLELPILMEKAHLFDAETEDLIV